MKTKYIVFLLSFLTCAQSNAMLQRFAALIVPKRFTALITPKRLAALAVPITIGGASGAICYKSKANRTNEERYLGYNIRFPIFSNRLILEPNHKLTSMRIKPHERHVHLLLEEEQNVPDENNNMLNEYLALKKSNILVSPHIWNAYCDYRKNEETAIKERQNTPDATNLWDLYHKKDTLLYLNPDTQINTRRLAKKVVSCRVKIVGNKLSIHAANIQDWDIQKTPSGLLFLAHKSTPGAKYFNTAGWEKQTKIAPVEAKPFCLASFKKLFPEKDPKTNWYFSINGHGNKETFWNNFWGNSMISGMRKNTIQGILSFIGENLNTKQVVIDSCFAYPQKIFDLMGTNTLPYDLITSNNKNELTFSRIQWTSTPTIYNFPIGFFKSVETLGKNPEEKIAILTKVYEINHKQLKELGDGFLESPIQPVLIKAGNEKPEAVISL